MIALGVMGLLRVRKRVNYGGSYCDESGCYEDDIRPNPDYAAHSKKIVFLEKNTHCT
jgi:hypothetical protein